MSRVLLAAFVVVAMSRGTFVMEDAYGRQKLEYRLQHGAGFTTEQSREIAHEAERLHRPYPAMDTAGRAAAWV